LFALHRFIQASIKPLDDARTPPNNLQWKDYLASGAAGFNSTSAPPIQLKAWINADLANLLSETPLSQDQALTAVEDGFTLTASVHDTWQLQWWILSQGARIVIQSPNELRQSIQQQVEQMHFNYQAK
jgi:predicted DNA-binding transcriptional regulator YafY